MELSLICQEATRDDNSLWAKVNQDLTNCGHVPLHQVKWDEQPQGWWSGPTMSPDRRATSHVEAGLSSSQVNLHVRVQIITAHGQEGAHSAGGRYSYGMASFKQGLDVQSWTEPKLLGPQSGDERGCSRSLRPISAFSRALRILEGFNVFCCLFDFVFQNTANRGDYA